MSSTVDQALRELLREAHSPLQKQIEALATRLTRDAAETDAVVSVRTAAKLASVSPGTVRNWVRTGQLSRLGAGRLVRIRRSDLLVLLSRGDSTDRTSATAEEQATRILSRR
jgi:excisionase family DNA binding protein